MLSFVAVQFNLLDLVRNHNIYFFITAHIVSQCGMKEKTGKFTLGKYVHVTFTPRAPYTPLLYRKPGVYRDMPFFVNFDPKHRLCVPTIDVVSKNIEISILFQ